MNAMHCRNAFFMNDPRLQTNARKAKIVLWITFVTMVIEIYYGYATGSMALLADGWHMSTHAAALGITWLTYKIAESPKMVENFNFGGGKIIALGGFASSVFLLLVALFVAFEACTRFFRPVAIEFDEALLVAVIGLVVNIVCAFVLREKPVVDVNELSPAHHSHGGHHSHGHHSPAHHSHGGDHNIKAAYMHVIADALTSVGAIVALLGGRLYGISWLDPLVGLVGAIVILKWAVGLIKETGWELLDGHARGINFADLTERLQLEKAEIIDLHVWRVGPSILSAELIIRSGSAKTIAQYRQILETEFGIHHSVIEER
jgi:cation diffusion facilitator family transporter